MNTRIFKMVALAFFIGLHMSVGAANLPATFQGAITLDGVAAPAHAILIAWLPGSTGDASCPLVTDGEYGPLQLDADNPATPGKEGGVEGDAVRFKLLVNDSVFNAVPVSVWRSGEVQIVNIEVWRNRAFIWSPTTALQFDKTALRSQSLCRFTVSNPGNADLVIDQVVALNNNFDVLFEDALIVRPDSSVVIQVFFRPETEGEVEDQLLISSNAGEWMAPVRGQGYELWPLHWRVNADTTHWLGSDNAARSVAYNRMTNHLAVVGPDLSIVHPRTGRLLNQSGALPEVWHRVAISADGQIFVCTLAINGADFKLYRYANELAEPSLIYQGVLDQRAGDALAVSGAGKDIKLLVSGVGSGKIFTFTTTDGMLYEKTSDILLPEAGAAGYSICTVPETDYLFVAGPAKSTWYIKTDGTPVFQFDAETIPAANLSYFEKRDSNGRLRRFLTFINGATPGTGVMELLGAAPENLCDQVMIWPAATPVYQQLANLNATAEVAYDGIDNTLIELVTNNGLSAYRFDQILAEPMPTAGFLIGKVTDGSNGSPIANAEVRILDLDWVTVTDDSGSYAFIDVPGQEYQVRVTALNFFSQMKAVVVADYKLAVADFALQQREYLPISVTACPAGPDVQLHWSLSRPQTRLWQHNDKPTSGWFQKMNKAYGALFNLSAYANATLEQLDFNHYSWQLLHGPYRYRVHIYNMMDSTQIAEIEGITSQDSWGSAQWETAVDLGSLSDLTWVGIFIEPLSGSADDAHPVLSTDSDIPVQPGINYIIEDLSDPFATMVETRARNNGYGNFLIDLWINHQGSRRQIIAAPAPTLAAYSAESGPTRGTIAAAQLHARPQPPTLQSLYGFRIYRNLSDTPGAMTLLATTPPNSYSFVDVDLAQDTTCVYGISALYDSVESAIVSIPYYHPPVLAIAQAREDDNRDRLLDRIGQMVTVSGVATTPNFGHRALSDFYIQDDHAGIHISCATQAMEISPGTQIYISGRVTDEAGAAALAVLQPASLQILKKEVPVTERLITFSQMSDSVESMLVKVEGCRLVNPALWPAAGQDGWVAISNGADTSAIFIDAGTDLDGAEPYSGFFNLVAVLDFSTSYGYALRPRQRADFSIPAGVGQSTTASVHYELQQNYPNPFNPVTTIVFTLPQTEPVRMAVVDISGREVALICHAPLSAGTHKFNFSGNGLASGVYFYQVATPTFRECKKMILVK